MHAAGAGANKKRMPIRNNENRPGALRVTGQCASLGQVRAPLLFAAAASDRTATPGTAAPQRPPQAGPGSAFVSRLERPR